MNYTSLVADKNTAGSIAKWVNYSQLDTETVLAEAQALLYQRLRVREMRTLDTSLTLQTGVAAYSLPSLFLDPIRPLTDTQQNYYEYKTEGELVASRSYDANGVINQGQPLLWSIFDEKIQFNVSPLTSGVVLNLLCFKSKPLLSASNLTNFLTDRYPQMLRTACLMSAADFMQDDIAYQKWGARLSEMVDVTNAESDLTYRGVELDAWVNV